MTRLRFKGLEDARDAGLMETAPDIRLGLGMSGFSFPENAVNRSDGTEDPFDGANYTPYDATGVTRDWVSNQRVWTCDNTGTDEFGTNVGPGSEPPSWLYAWLHVDGDPDNDIMLCASDDGNFNDGNGSDMGLTLPNDIAVFARNAT